MNLIKYIKNILLLPIFIGLGFTQDFPGCTINPAEYELSANLTGVLSINNELADGDYVIGVFSGGECRGSSEALFALDNWIYFITMYANSSGEAISFKAYDPIGGNIIVLENEIEFIPNAVYGSPLNPFSLTGYVNFDHHPELSDISGQVIEQGSEFDGFDLNDFLTILDDDAIIFSYSGDDNLQVDIAAGFVSITPYSSNWQGTETITFYATDDTDNGYVAEASAEFTVIPVDNPPALNSIDDQTVGFGGSFDDIYLGDYLLEINGDDVSYSFAFNSPEETDDEPNWSVSPFDFEMSMTVTAVVSSKGADAGSGSHILAAFSGDECRGTATPISVLGGYIYFLTLYSNENGEDISFRFYDNNLQQDLSIGESLSFSSNASYGTPQSPFDMNAGQILITISDDGVASIDIIDHLWSGAETVTFIASDVGTLNNYSGSTEVTFTILPDNTPLLSSISNQTIETGDSFDDINLEYYLSEIDGDAVEYSATGNTALNVDFFESTVSISPINSNWVGTENITFTVTDLTDNALHSSTNVQFTILPVDNPPMLSNIPSQTIGVLNQFDSIYLDDYLLEEDGDDTEWSVSFLPPAVPESNPGWSVNPSAYELTMTLTATVSSLGLPAEGSANLLGAFSDSGDCIGSATAIEFLGDWIYFITIHGNSNGEAVSLKFYDDATSQVIPVKEGFTFSANSSTGIPTSPFILNAGRLLINIDGSAAEIDIVDLAWSGTESVLFSVNDVGTLNEYSASTEVSFTVLPDYAPTVAGIPDQTIEAGSSFADINLNDYLTVLDDDPISWSSSGSSNLSVSISSGWASVSYSGGFTGSENITFTATDQTGNGFSGSEGVLFTVLPVDNPPSIGGIPSQSMTLGGTFDPINLSANMIELDGDELYWDYDYPNADAPEAQPNWSVNPFEFELSMTVTTRVLTAGNPTHGSSHILAAFSGNESRGTAQAISVLGEWLYFLTVYSNNNGEEITFRFFDESRESNYPVLESLTFSTQAAFGTPMNPYELQAGFVLLDLTSQETGIITRVDNNWTGSTDVEITVMDVGSLNEYFDMALVSLTVLNDQPVVGSIPGQTIEEGGSFTAINLNDFVFDYGTADSEIIWTVVGNNELQVNITNQVALITTPNENWGGQEYLTFTAMDDDPNTPMSASTTATFAVNAGCMNTDACNYNPNATTDDGSCLQNDCAGACGGTAVVDECGVCGGDGSDDVGCGCFEAGPSGCDNVCNSTAVEDCAGVCGGDSVLSGCDNVCNSIAVDDCAGVCGGDAVLSGCDNVCNSIAVDDCAGVCGGDSVLSGCDNACGSNLENDACGACDGSGVAEACDCIDTSGLNDDGCCDSVEPAEGLDCDGEPLSLLNDLIPENFSIHSIYPNPFNPVTNIIYGLPEYVNVQIIVYNISGKQIETLINQFQSPGYHFINWNADSYSSGVYFVKMVAGSYVNTQKLMLVK